MEPLTSTSHILLPVNSLALLRLLRGQERFGKDMKLYPSPRQTPLELWNSSSCSHQPWGCQCSPEQLLVSPQPQPCAGIWSILSSSGTVRFALSNGAAEFLKRVPRFWSPSCIGWILLFAIRQRAFLVFSYPNCRVEQAIENPTCL